MEEPHSLEEASRKLLIETIEFVIIFVGIAVIGTLGWMVLMPMTVGLFFYFPCAFVIDMMQRLRDAGRR